MENETTANKNDELDVMLNTFSADVQWVKSFNENSELTLGAQGNLQSHRPLAGAGRGWLPL